MFNINMTCDGDNVYQLLVNKDEPTKCFPRRKDRKFSLYDDIHLCNEYNIKNNNSVSEDCKELVK